ncbi:MAG: tryptophan 7-halogenase [Acidobacteriaceae bacterium]|nr:tryptophan 7-halogenase [Acidobacteriaceae bacterium]
MPDHDSALQYDVAVVGGGPGGSTVATLARLGGARVLLLEKEASPAYKIGESLLPATIHGICPLLGVSDAIKKAKFVPKMGGTFRWGKSPEPWTFEFASSASMRGPTSTAFQVERIKFDRILLDNARDKGVDVRLGCAATGLLSDQGRVNGLTFLDSSGVSQNCRARYVVDASGHQTALAKAAGERIYSKFFQNIALFGYYRNGGRLPKPNQGNIFCAAFEHGWFWYIPLSDTLTSVGAVIGKEQAPILSSGYETAMSELISACAPVRDLLSGAERVTEGTYGQLRVRKDYSYSHTRFWAPGLVLVGDAACFIDPVFSSGVHLATYSGLLAARSINTCLENSLNEEECFGEFEARYRREYSHFYDFLLAFYDVDEDVDSYYWQARKILNSPESGNDAFIDLVAGVGGGGERLYGSAEEYLSERNGLGSVLFPDSSTDRSTNKKTEDKRAAFYTDLLGEITQVQVQAMWGDVRPSERPVFPGGLIPSQDGLHWTRPTVSKKAAGLRR